jgi:hypothetical protein
MSNFSKRLLLWTPRVVSITFIAFLSLFALDVFNEHLSFWNKGFAKAARHRKCMKSNNSDVSLNILFPNERMRHR